ncbi:MAG: hypothetical protein RL660_1742 [Bacteroidota bacterium]|jgi:hypothetical protein
MNKSKINLPSPCTENIDKMDLTSEGRYCQNCKKEIIDFRNFTTDDFNRYFSKHAKSGCGIFYASQIEKVRIEIDESKAIQGYSGFQKFIIAFFIVFGIELFNVELSFSQTNGDSIVENKLEVTNIFDSVQHDDSLVVTNTDTANNDTANAISSTISKTELTESTLQVNEYLTYTRGDETLYVSNESIMCGDFRVDVLENSLEPTIGDDRHIDINPYFGESSNIIQQALSKPTEASMLQGSQESNEKPNDDKDNDKGKIHFDLIANMNSRRRKEEDKSEEE